MILTKLNRNMGLALMLMTAVMACAQPSDDEKDFEARPIDGGKGVEITGYTGSGGKVNIPARIQKLPVTSIGEEAFYGKRLISVTIPNSVTIIGDLAFASNQLTSVTIPNSVTTIGVGAFANNPGLTAINVSAGNPNYSSDSGVLYSKNKTTLVAWPAGKTPVRIPNSVTTIGNAAFVGNQLTSVTIPNSVTTIGVGAFATNQLTMTSITIGANVTLSTGRSASFGDGFGEAYNNGGKRAGTYTRPNTDSTTWTRK